jgi:hypothetical protein
MAEAIQTQMVPIEDVKKIIAEVVRETLGEAARFDYVEERVAALELRMMMRRPDTHFLP